VDLAPSVLNVEPVSREVTSPNTGWPGRLAGVPVPEVTTARTSVRSSSTAAEGSVCGWLGWGVEGSVIRVGGCQEPLSTAAATNAIPRGLLRMRPCPIMSAACSTVLADGGACPL
jgi:hypothetical protein